MGLGVVLSLITFKLGGYVKSFYDGLGVVLSLITFKPIFGARKSKSGFGSSAIFNYF